MMYAFSARYDAALALAARAHHNQLRKGTDLPYITHPVHVSVILLRHGFAEDIVIAGLLHDVVEDTKITLETIRTEFGTTVADLVAAVTEAKAQDGIELPWEQRKAEQLDHLAVAGPEVAALKAADAIHNAHAILSDLQSVGPSIWTRFKRGPQPTLAYYQALRHTIRHQLGQHPIADELAEAVQALEIALSST